MASGFCELGGMGLTLLPLDQPHMLPSSAAALRSEMPMNIKFSGGGAGYAKPYPPALASNLARINEIFEKTRERFGASGPFLFGCFCAADAMFAPVCMRLRSYVVEVGGERRNERRRVHMTPCLPARSFPQLPSAVAREYVATVLADAAVGEWVAAARREQADGARAIAHYDAMALAKGALEG